MQRGLLAPLSPNEEITLRRIALGSASALPEAAIVRLRKLELIEGGADNVWTLTPLGQRRYDSLSRPEPSDDIGRMLASFRKPEDQA
jgi:hypothetical protein